MPAPFSHRGERRVEQMTVNHPPEPWQMDQVFTSLARRRQADEDGNDTKVPHDRQDVTGDIESGLVERGKGR